MKRKMTIKPAWKCLTVLAALCWASAGVAAQQAQTQYAQAKSQQLDVFFRAYGACLQGRGYSVN